MTKTYRLSGIELDAADIALTASPNPPTSKDIHVSHRRTIMPGAARDAGAVEFEAAGDEVVRVQLENGFVLWSRVDDLIRDQGRKSPNRGNGDVWEIDVRPRQRGCKGSARGGLGIGIKVLEFFGVDLKSKAALELGQALEKKLLRGHSPGLYSCSLDGKLALTEVAQGQPLPTTAGPILLFIHGTGSSCQGSFGKLMQAGDEAQQLARAKLREIYGDRVYAYEHRSLTESPIKNALELAQRLPKKTPIHLVTHSRGGLVGELLCLAQREQGLDPLNADTVEKLFATDHTMAEQLGLHALGEKEKKERDEAYQNDRKRLIELLAVLDEKRFTISRFVRVACPARGTTLASGRLDRWLSVLDLVSGHGLFGDVADFLLAVVKQRTDPRTLPGLEAMMPGSALTNLLNLPDLKTASDLTVISGDIDGEGLWGQIKLFAIDWFYGAEHDLVVNTGSMYGGLRRTENGARFIRDKGEGVNHFNYFSNAKSVRWVIAGLARVDGADGGFMPISEAKQEAPKWREAVRRSRASTTPLPIAVVLPGTMGSALHVSSENVWVNYRRLLRGGLKHIRMGAVGVEPTDLLDDFYGPLLEFLAGSHRVEIFPYDWRLSVQDAAAKLMDKLEIWLPDAERSGQPLHLVAHSMGGLVVRAMLADTKRGAAIWRRITALPNSRFMMLGTPNRGSYEALRWLTGHNPTELKLSLLDFTQSTDQIIDIVRRFPGLLELLPFGDDDADFSQQSRWQELKEALQADWEPAEMEALRNARSTWTLLNEASVDPERMIYVAGCQRATVTDYRLMEGDGELPIVGRKVLDFIGTHQGDGTVTWKSGKLPGVKTWFVDDTAHDELCSQRSAFPGYLDLLLTGNTKRLKDTPPAQSRAAGEPEQFSMPRQPFTDSIPDESSVRCFGFGPGRPVRDATEAPALPMIRIGITHGDLAYAKHHVLVGHYIGDTIVSAEAALDKVLDHALSERLALGIYPGPVQTHALFCNQKAGAKPVGALVLGIGQVGDLSPGVLEECVRKAMLDFALLMSQRVIGLDQPRGVYVAALSCMLVGSGAGGMTVRDSTEAILRGAVAANRKLVDAGSDNKVLIDEIEFIELFEDVALAAAEALEQILSDGELVNAVEWSGRTVKRGEGGHRRVRFDEAPDWWHRLEIIQDKGSDGLRFIATTDRARAEVTQSYGQLLLADAFIQRATQSPQVHAEAAKTLFEMLVPNRLKEMAPKQSDLVLIVDEMSARYPWELLQDRWSQTERPPAVAGGLVRQFKTRSFRAVTAHAVEAKAFVVGNPDLEGWREFPDLRGAHQEAQQVAAVLAAGGFAVDKCIDERADKIIGGLHRDAWRILHLAGHGVHDFPLLMRGEGKGKEKDENCLNCGQKMPEQQKYVSGMVIGKNTFLTPGDVEQMRWVPELVFINCCHLGKTQSTVSTEYNLLAANLAMQFIGMGVKAVVAAGWAVDDGAALAFAESFYSHLLDGDFFGESVRAAREEIWVQYPEVNTWGAYQCYGDPSYRLRSDGNSSSRRASRPFHSMAEIVAELQNMVESIRMESRDSSDNIEALKALRQRIESLIKRIPEKHRDAWLKRGDVAMGLGLVFGEIGAYADAIEWLEVAMRADKGEISMRAWEQCANFQVRSAGEQWQLIQTEAKSARTKQARAHHLQEREALIKRIEKARAGLDFLCERAPTVERLNLLGSAYKRLAIVNEAGAKRQQALLNMANSYHRAFKQAEPNLYPFTNWALASTLKESRKSSKHDDELLSLRDECQRMIEIAKERENMEPNFWNSVAQPDLEVVMLLAQPKLTAKLAEAEAQSIIAGYRAAFKRGASPREMASVRENIDFIIAMHSMPSKPLQKALAAIRAAL